MILDNVNEATISVMQGLFDLSSDRTKAIKVLYENGIDFGDLEFYFGVSDGEYDEIKDEIYYDILRDEIADVLGRDKERAYAYATDFEDRVTTAYTDNGGDMADIDEELLDDCIKNCYIESVR